jgi:hypothetical protein
LKIIEKLQRSELGIPTIVGWGDASSAIATIETRITAKYSLLQKLYQRKARQLVGIRRKLLVLLRSKSDRNNQTAFSGLL